MTQARLPPAVACRVYGIADAKTLHPIPLTQAVGEMVAAGIGWIQVRAKELSGRELFRQLDQCCRQVEGLGVELWINDRVDLAALLPVEGVHLGQEDLEPGSARRLLGVRTRVGVSTHSLEQVGQAEGDAAVDVLAFGPIFSTQSKKRPDPVVGVEGLRLARQLTRKPLVAIGGIDARNARQVLEAGADAVAVIGALCRTDDVRRSSIELLNAVAG